MWKASKDILLAVGTVIFSLVIGIYTNSATIGLLTVTGLLYLQYRKSTNQTNIKNALLYTSLFIPVYLIASGRLTDLLQLLSQ